MAEVFISYAREDEAVARRLAKALEQRGHDVWWDARLPAHRTYSEVIERNLREAKAVVVLWSAHSATSQWVRAEADLARSEHKLVQAQIDGTLPPLPFNQIQSASLKGWRGSAAHAGLSKLVASVSELVSGEDEGRAAETEARRWWTQRRFYWAAAAAAALLLVAAIVLVPKLAGTETARPVIAVLPFESLDQRDASLVAGIWEDTRQALSRNPQLLVLGPNTAEELAERGMDATKKAADYVLEASVRSLGDRIRINTNLVRTDDGAQLWSENFDRKLDDVFELQTEIAQEIEGRIRGRLATGGGVRPQNIATTGEVYALYNDARAKIRKRDGIKYREALQQLQQVVQLDPNFAPGWATLAVMQRFGLTGETAPKEQAEANARRAIALAPNLAAAHAALGFVLSKGPAAEAALRRAVALDPNDFEAIHWLANSLDKSRAEEKLELWAKAAEIEPLFWPALYNLVTLVSESGSPDVLEAQLARVEKLGDDRLASLVRMEIARGKGDLSTAIAIGLGIHRRASGPEREGTSPIIWSALIQLNLFDEADQLFPPPSEWIPHIRRNDPRAIDLIEEELSAKAYWSYGPLPIVAARVYLLNGQGRRLAKRYREAAASPEEFEALVSEESLPDIAPSVALALRTAGEASEAEQLLALAEKKAALPTASPLDRQIRFARIYAAQGRKDEAIAQLSSAVQRGWLPPYMPVHTDIALDPPLAEMKGDPRFERIRQQILGHIAKERAELGAVRPI